MLTIICLAVAVIAMWPAAVPRVLRGDRLQGVTFRDPSLAAPVADGDSS